MHDGHIKNIRKNHARLPRGHIKIIQIRHFSHRINEKKKKIEWEVVVIKPKKKKFSLKQHFFGFLYIFYEFIVNCVSKIFSLNLWFYGSWKILKGARGNLGWLVFVLRCGPHFTTLLLSCFNQFSMQVETRKKAEKGPGKLDIIWLGVTAEFLYFSAVVFVSEAFFDVCVAGGKFLRRGWGTASKISRLVDNFTGNVGRAII